MPLRTSCGLALGVALLTAGCGYDNPGEPRTPAEELSAPNLGDVHVYCVEGKNPVTACTVDLAADRGHSHAELRAWWLRAARALRKAGTFHYKDGDWRFAEVFVEEPGKADDGITYGWRCPGDEKRSQGYVWKLMVDRMPGGTKGIQTLAAAQRRGCTFAPSPFSDA
jgi:hypothetical protein